MSFIRFSLLVVVALVVSTVHAATSVSYLFNASFVEECRDAQAPCSFTNASLWIPNGVPSVNDDAKINSTVGNPVYFAITSPVTVTTVTLTNAALSANSNFGIVALVLINSTATVSTNGTLSTSVIIFLSASSELIVTGGQLASSSVNAILAVQEGASLRLLDGATLAWTGDLDVYGVFEAQSTTKLNVGQLLLASSTVSIAAPITVITLTVNTTSLPAFTTSVTGGVVVLPNSAFTLNSAAFTGSIQLQSSSSVATISNSTSVQLTSTVNNYNRTIQAVSGVGALHILTSSATVSNVSASTFNGTVVLGGLVSATFNNVSLLNFNFTNGANNEAPSVTLVANGLTIAGNTTVAATVVAQGSSGLTITGSVVVNGQLNANNSAVNVPGTLTVSTALSPTNSSITLGGTLLSASLELDSASTLTVNTEQASLIGSLANNGVVDVASDRALLIWIGDYVQGNTALHVSLNKEGPPALNVLNGSIVLANESTLSINIRDKPFLSSASFLVARASVNGTINGTFLGDAAPFAGSQINRALGISIDHEAKTISIQYNFNAKDVDAWVWAVLAIAITAVIVGVVFVVFRLRRRHRYSSLAVRY